MAAADKEKPQLILIDQESGAGGGWQLFHDLKAACPQIPIVLLSAENDIPTAVLATKAGAAAFLKKPFTSEQLRGAVDQVWARSTREYYRFRPDGWLRGESQLIKRLHETIRRVLHSSTNIILRGEPGIDQREVVEFLHANGFRPRRQLCLIDLASFRRENQEASFWSTAQKVLAESPGQPEDERCGTLYLSNSAALEINFQASIFDYFASRRGETRIVIGRGAHSPAPKDYAAIDLPPLRERREDLLQLCGEALQRSALKHNKPVSGFSAELLAFLGFYDFPGNYTELAGLIEQGVLLSAGGMLELRDLAVDYRSLKERAIKRAAWSGEASLAENKRDFEVELYRLLMSKCGDDMLAVARFLDLPRTALAERLTELS